nr:uncharacterized protein LOC113725040 isoform X2 [Coffea arabica]
MNGWAENLFLIGIRRITQWILSFGFMASILYLRFLLFYPTIGGFLSQLFAFLRRIALCICLPNLRGDHQMALSLALKRLVSSNSLLSRSLNPLLRPAASAASSSVFDVVDRRSDRPLDHRRELSCFPGSIGVCR